VLRMGVQMIRLYKIHGPKELGVSGPSVEFVRDGMEGGGRRERKQACPDRVRLL